MLLSRFAAGIASVGLIVMGMGVASGQGYPNKPIRLVTTGAGGGSDFISRQIALGISGPLGQTVIVDNRGGGFVPAEIVSKTPPDGYTLLVTGASLWVSPLLQKAPYDVLRDFSPVSLLVRTVTVLVVHPSVPVTSVKELITLAKAKPGELNYSSASIGGAGHLAGELFKSMAGVNIVHVPYKATALAITAVLGGEVQMTIFDAGLVMPHVKSGKLKGLAVTSAQPSSLAPGLPTVAASGVPGYESGATQGMWVPAKTPRTIIDRLNKEVVRMLQQADVRERLIPAGMEAIPSSPEQFAATVKSEIAKWSKVIKEASIKGT